MELIASYFPELSDSRLRLLKRYAELLVQWNQKVNLISRKDEENVMERHILHSLAIAKFIQFRSGSRVLDFGSGGGLPGVPLAICLPETDFTLVDSIGKKVDAIRAMAKDLELQNITCQKTRVKDMNGRFDFVVCRAVASTDKLIKWTKHLVANNNQHPVKNGLLALKGGDLSEELSSVKQKCKVVDLSQYFKEEFFETKKLLHVMYC